MRFDDAMQMFGQRLVPSSGQHGISIISTLTFPHGDLLLAGVDALHAV